MALTAIRNADHAGCQDRGQKYICSAQFHGAKEQVEKGVVELYFVRTRVSTGGLYSLRPALETILIHSPKAWHEVYEAGDTQKSSG
ncbi:hypothetical protein Tco_0164503 [Tanacetum coccineum]